MYNRFITENRVIIVISEIDDITIIREPSDLTII